MLLKKQSGLYWNFRCVLRPKILDLHVIPKDSGVFWGHLESKKRRIFSRICTPENSHGTRKPEGLVQMMFLFKEVMTSGEPAVDFPGV